MITSKIRAAFLEYFSKNTHIIQPSSPLVPHDPTLLFVNAGMVPFKPFFTGEAAPEAQKLATVQKCVRAGGKHNDLENVGYTARHHTFFEMLGNFSFGEYFKEEAILYAWNFLVHELGIPQHKLHVTIFHEDTEALALWQKIAGYREEEIIKIATADNFWSMGATGPCGPCSEIFYDHGDHLPGNLPGSGQEGDRFVEIWNLVFMQFDQQEDGRLLSLPKPCIDTGMGLERIVAVMQGVFDNYDTDIFKTLRQIIADLTQTSMTGPKSVSHRVIADHMRSSSFLIADGVLPSNEGRGYVLRRIMRRALRHVYQLGHTKGPLLYKLTAPLVALMGDAYPELKRAKKAIETMLKEEETRFQEMLGRGLKLLQEELKNHSASQLFPGGVAFKLYDTYGFPLDLTEDILREYKISVDTESFSNLMEAQREKARQSWTGSGDSKIDAIWHTLAQNVPETLFLGYEQETAEAKAIALVHEGKRVNSLHAGQKGYVILDQTPFYAEAGGQLGDQGVLFAPELQAQVLNTTKVGALFLHQVDILEGDLIVGTPLEAIVDQERRQQLRCNHSATHLLHAALRKRLGEGVMQKGSLVGPQRLRFDFSYSKPLPLEEIHFLEQEVNRCIQENTLTLTETKNPEQAFSEGAIGLFGEKYTDQVRVVKIGSVQDMSYSHELCGGTHVRQTGEIGCFKIIDQSSVAAGVRRLEAVTGQQAIRWIQNQEYQLRTVAELLKSAPLELESKIRTLLAQRKELEKTLQENKKKVGKEQGPTYTHKNTFAGVNIYFQVYEGMAAKEARGIVDALRAKESRSLFLIVCVQDTKVTLLLGVTADLTPQCDAATLMPLLTPIVGGQGGGGRPDFAQGGGTNPKNLKELQDTFEQVVAQQVASSLS